MRLTFSLADLFHTHAATPPVSHEAGTTPVPLAEVEDSVPTMGLLSGAMMLVALPFSRNRLPHRQRAAGMAKRAVDRSDA